MGVKVKVKPLAGKPQDKFEVDTYPEADGLNVTPAGDLVVIVLKEVPTPQGAPPAQTGIIIKAYPKGRWLEADYEQSKIDTKSKILPGTNLRAGAGPGNN